MKRIKDETREMEILEIEERRRNEENKEQRKGFLNELQEKNNRLKEELERLRKSRAYLSKLL